MESLGNYILSVTSAAILLAVLLTLLSKNGSTSSLLRLIGGLFLTFTLVVPLTDLKLDDIFDSFLNISSDGNSIAAYGQECYQTELASIIKQRCEAYILDKAQSLGAELTVEVTVSQDDMPVPLGATMRGSISPYARSQLASVISDQLGIPKEDQQWIG